MYCGGRNPFGRFYTFDCRFSFGTRYLGLGTDTIYDVLSGGQVPYLLSSEIICHGSDAFLWRKRRSSHPYAFVGATAGSTLALINWNGFGFIWHNGLSSSAGGRREHTYNY